MAGSFKVVISPDGSSISVDIDGVQGTSCVNLTKIFSSIGQNMEMKKKAEYYIEAEDNISVSG